MKHLPITCHVFTIINTIVDHLSIDNEHCKCRKGRIDLHE